MAFLKFVAATLLVSLLICHLAVAEEKMVSESQVSTNSNAKIDCKGQCRRRCALSRRPNLCHRACGTCCARCNCVPPGTSGNQAVCACYYNMKTHGGRRKCP